MCSAYWGDSQSFTNPCAGGTAANQAGLAHTRTGPDPDGAGPGTARVEESVYDPAGRVVASRRNTDPWTCVTYDTRGRVTSRVSPAFGGAPARTTTWSWAVGANPLVTSVSDPAGTITTTVDLWGRVVAYSDVWGQTTTTSYDDYGRVASTAGPAGTVTPGYLTGGTAPGMLGTVTVDATVMATLTYSWPWGELQSIAYANATGVSIGLDNWAGAPSSLTFTQAGGASLTKSTVTRTAGGRITASATDSAGSTFTYDSAGRLTAATIPGHSLAYTYPATGGCGTLTTSGKNTDRATMVDNGVTSTSCHDQADRLTSTTGIASIVYDTHGNTTTLGATSLGFDNDGRNTSITTGGATVAYTRDATGRIVARTDSTGTTRYLYAGDGDSPVATANTSGVIAERFVALPGGVTVTRRSTSQVWSYPNIHGDIAAVADAAGAKTGTTLTYDPYGQPLTTAPDNVAGAADWGWEGQHHKLTEPTGIIQMGARPYQPSLGRFLTIDPVAGGSANDFSYVKGDPISASDLDGTCAKHKGLLGRARDVGCHTGNGAKVVLGKVGAGGRLVVRCAKSLDACETNIEIAISPLVAAGLTATAITAVVMDCAGTAGLGCAPGVILIAPFVAAGVAGTVLDAKKVWFGDDLDDVYVSLDDE